MIVQISDEPGEPPIELDGEREDERIKLQRTEAKHAGGTVKRRFVRPVSWISTAR